MAVHRLVAQAFVPNPFNLPEVNHTGAKIDNRHTQLEWKSVVGHGRDKAKREQKGDGVYFEPAKNRWRAVYYPLPNKKVALGTFTTYEAARTARIKAMNALPDVQ